MKMTASEQIKALLREGKEGEIQKNLIMESLREEGIKDLETMVARSIEMQKKSQPVELGQVFPESAKMSPEDARIELLFGNKARNVAKDVAHQEPKLPFFVRDTIYKPSEIKRFNGQVLHWVWDNDAIATGLLKAVTDPEEFRAALFAKPAGIEGREMAVRHHVPGAGHTFYQHINFGGHVLNLSYRHALPDLTSNTMSGFWFWATSWNDQISSLRTGSGPVTLAEHVMRPYLTGATMNIGAFTSISWIGQAWNDRISAILG